MNPAIHLTLADIVFHIRNSGAEIPAGNYDEPCYRDFETQLTGTTNGRAPAPADIDMEISRARPPSIMHYRQLYAGAGSWSFYSDGADCALTLHPPSMARPVWTALTDSFFSRVSLYLDGDYPLNVPVRYPLDQILLFHHLARRRGVILHAAGMKCTAKAYLFPGISGAGKSTITNLLGADGRFSFLSDDRIIVRQVAGVCRGYGTPWPGDAGIAVNNHAPLAGIYFLRKGPANRLMPLSPREAFERLMPVASIPWYHPFLISQLFDFLQDLVREVPAHDLHFFPSTDLGDFLARSLA